MKSLIFTLLVALKAVESSNGLTSHNQYQIRDICIQDVNRIYGTHFTMHDVYYKDTYWGHHYKEVTGKCPTFETYAII